jgi:hypothetical protein
MRYAALRSRGRREAHRRAVPCIVARLRAPLATKSAALPRPLLRARTSRSPARRTRPWLHDAKRDPTIAKAVRGLSVDDALIGCPAVVLRNDGRSDFGALSAAARKLRSWRSRPFAS